MAEDHGIIHYEIPNPAMQVVMNITTADSNRYGFDSDIIGFQFLFYLNISKADTALFFQYDSFHCITYLSLIIAVPLRCKCIITS